jgi:hypothetical protein
MVTAPPTGQNPYRMSEESGFHGQPPPGRRHRRHPVPRALPKQCHVQRAPPRRRAGNSRPPGSATYLTRRSGTPSPNSGCRAYRRGRRGCLHARRRYNGDDVHLGPAVGKQPNNKLDREPRAANDRLTGEHVGIERNARMLCYYRRSPPFQGEIYATHRGAQQARERPGCRPAANINTGQYQPRLPSKARHSISSRTGIASSTGGCANIARREPRSRSKPS